GAVRAVAVEHESLGGQGAIDVDVVAGHSRIAGRGVGAEPGFVVDVGGAGSRREIVQVVAGPLRQSLGIVERRDQQALAAGGAAHVARRESLLTVDGFVDLDQRLDGAAPRSLRSTPRNTTLD